ncbi:MAG: hypothetical protein LBE81_00370 [Azonexus sp.]|jgi:hypothetical protein|uniref:hypothetical protein n=1 Tax=Azonexus sp. TaxID=1872668 RepID=UPI0028360200|nr:hypothetical protein [Azonexus sp.]MDR0775083.1 hypothetical protein [Azonexus sp.]
MLYSQLDPELAGMLLATLLSMQWLGPLATQAAVKGFGAAICLVPRQPAAAGTHGGTS